MELTPDLGIRQFFIGTRQLWRGWIGIIKWRINSGSSAGDSGGPILPPQVKTQYLQIQNIVETSIKHPISSQSTTVVKDCMYI